MTSAAGTTGRNDVRFHSQDTVDNPLNADPIFTGDATLTPIDPELEKGQEGGLTGQVNQALPGVNLTLNSTPDTDASFVHVAAETLLGQEANEDDS